MLERKYIIPLRREFLKVQKYRRGYKATKAIKEFLMKHMKTNDVRICRELNQYILKHGRENPPSRVEVKSIRIEEKDAEPYVMVNLIGAQIDVKEKEKKKTLGEKLKEKVTAKPGIEDAGKEEMEKKKRDVLDHAKLDQKRQHMPEKIPQRKASPKAEMIIGDTGKK